MVPDLARGGRPPRAAGDSDAPGVPVVLSLACPCEAEPGAPAATTMSHALLQCHADEGSGQLVYIWQAALCAVTPGALHHRSHLTNRLSQEEVL